MKKLYIVRHGKAEGHFGPKSDYDRDLVEAGVQRSYFVAEELRNYISAGDRIAVLSSSANRAKQTAVVFCEELGVPLEGIVYDRRLYEAGYRAILQLINTMEATDNDILLVFGHNPGLSDLASYLSGINVQLRPANVAMLSMEEGLDFATLSGGTCHLTGILG